MESGNVQKKKSKLIITLITVIGVTCLGILIFSYDSYASFFKTSDKASSAENAGINDEFYYYDEVTSYVNTYVNYITAIYPTVMNGDVNHSNEESILKATNDFLLFSQSFSAEPSNETDELFRDHFRKLQTDAEGIANYIKDYLFKEEDVYLKFIKNNYKNTQIHLDTMNEFRKLHYIDI